MPAMNIQNIGQFFFQRKAADQMEWVGRMNNIRQRAEEVVLSELIYC